jgi:hypothetical protein
MNKKIEKYIPRALEAVRDILAHEDKDGKLTQVYEEYDGYAASFGASVVTSGLLPTLSFYTDVHKKDTKDGKPATRRFRILIALAQTLELNGLPFGPNDKTALLKFAIGKQSSQTELKDLKSQILAASVALKLALRNFQHVKSPTANES